MSLYFSKIYIHSLTAMRLHRGLIKLNSSRSFSADPNYNRAESVEDSALFDKEKFLIVEFFAISAL